MEIAAGLLSCALTPLCSSLYNRCNYIRKYEEHKETFEREVEQLKSRGNDLSDEVNRGKQQHGNNPKREITLWLENWQKLVDRIESMKIENENSMCLRGRCPNCYLRWKQGKRIEKLMNEVRDLQVKSQFSNGLFVDSLPQVSFPATNLQGRSAERKKDEILKCIMDPEVSKIGVYGMGGVGKTTIMMQIYNQLKKSRDFDSVIWVTVSSSFNLERLQDKIADQLGCQLSSSADETSRAMVLHEAFRRRRNFVIILDDLWEKFSLQNVGIPEPADRSNGSKIVWTTRSIKVCNSMESQREIKIEGLTNEEAWSLFKDKVGGEDVIISFEIEPIARQVAKECGGLPLALITVARALRKTNQVQVWRSALQQLKFSSTDQIDGMGKDVFGSLKFSYNWLSNDKLRACFLYCVLYPEDYEINVDQLIEYWIAEGLIDEEGSTIEKDKGHAILKELKDACMIESGKTDESVKLHDLIRDLAINIVKKQPLFMVKTGLELEESPKEEEWVQNLERVSLMHNHIRAFEGRPDCPRLSTLLLKQNYRTVTFSDTFFQHMHNLRVLDLSQTGIKSLPDSLSDLTNLRALILMDCMELMCLPSLAKLQELRWLVLRRASFLTELPDGLENLVKLRHLDVSYGNWMRFPSEALSQMTHLEVLFMQKNRWRILLYRNNEDAQDNSTFGEIINLKNLTRFSANFSDVLTFNNYIKSDQWKLLEFFHFLICVESLNYDGHSVRNESTEKIILPSTANHLAIDDSDFVNLSDIFGSDSLTQLIDCRIQSCHEIKWIQKDGEIVFPNLEKLLLVDLYSFQGLCKEKAHAETLKNLRHLFIFNCHRLKYLIPVDSLENNLQNLEKILIQECRKIEGIVASDASASTITLPKLKELELVRLPALTSIYQGKLVCNSLCKIHVMDCPNMKKLPFLMNNAPPNLEQILGSKEWWKALEWDDQQLKKQLHPFFLSKTVPRCLPKLFWNKDIIRVGKFDGDEWEE